MSYQAVRQYRVDDIRSIVLNEPLRRQAVEGAVRELWSYQQQALRLGTEADLLAYKDLPEQARDAYRDAYLCQVKAIRVLDSFYGFLPSGRVPCMDDLIATARYFSDQSGSYQPLHGTTH